MPQIYFVSPTVKPGDDVRVNGVDCHAGAPWREYTQPLIVINGTEYSNYHGGPSERSNERVLLAAFPLHLVRLIGSHGYSGLAYQGYLGPVPHDPELDEMIQAIPMVGCLDSEDVSDLECVLEAEAWEADGRQEFVKVLDGVLDVLDDDAPHDVADSLRLELDKNANETIDKLWRDGCAALNVNGGSGHIIGTGCTVHFYTKEWGERATNPRWLAAPKHAFATSQIADLLHKLRNLAMRTRIAQH